MNRGLIINDVKYMRLMDPYYYKARGLYDNMFFTMRDIYANTHSQEIINELNEFNEYITSDVSFANLTEKFYFKYDLNKKWFLEKVLRWLKKISIFDFEFVELKKGEKVDMTEYMKWDYWWLEFEELQELIMSQYMRRCMEEKECEVKNITMNDLGGIEIHADLTYCATNDPYFWSRGWQSDGRELTLAEGIRGHKYDDDVILNRGLLSELLHSVKNGCPEDYQNHL